MTKRNWERVVFGVRDADVVVWGADPGGKGWEGGCLERFWGRWWGGEWDVCCFLGKVGANLCGSLPYVFPLRDLRDSGFVPLRGLDFAHFVHGILSMGLGP